MRKKWSFIIVILSLINCSRDFKNYSNELGKFSILFPDSPTYSKKLHHSNFGETEIHSFNCNPMFNDNLSYELLYFDYPKSFVDTLTRENTYSLFDGSQYTNLTDSTIRLLNVYNIEKSGYLGREYRWQQENGILTNVRFYLVNHRQYILTVKTPPKNKFNKSISDYFDSFKLIDVLPIKENKSDIVETLTLNYKITFPGTTEKRTIESPSEYGDIKINIEAYQPKLVNDDNLIYMFSVTQFPYNISDNDTFNIQEHYNEVIQSALIGRQSELISSNEITHKQLKGIQFKERFMGGQVIITNRAFLLNDKQFGIQVMTIPKNDQNMAMIDFLNSFEVLN